MARYDKYSITEGTMTDIADAIRAQLNTGDQYSPEEMPSAILSISGGGGGESFSGLKIDGGGNYDSSGYPIANLNIPGNNVLYENFMNLSGSTITGLYCDSLEINVMESVSNSAITDVTITDYIKITANTLESGGLSNVNNDNPEMMQIYIILSCQVINDRAIVTDYSYQGPGMAICILSDNVTIGDHAIEDNGNAVTDIYVPFFEGQISGAPWGAYNATVHYNTQFDETGKPI